MWLIVGQTPIKVGWWDASLALWDFSRSNKHCVQLSTTNTIYISRFVIAISVFRSSRLELFCKKGILKNFGLFQKILNVSSEYSCKDFSKRKDPKRGGISEKGNKYPLRTMLKDSRFLWHGMKLLMEVLTNTSCGNQ